MMKYALLLLLGVLLVACSGGASTPAPVSVSQPIATPPTVAPTQAPAVQVQAATAAPAKAGMIQPQQVSIDTQGLPYSYQPNLVPATPYSQSQPPGPTGLPQHIEINFGVMDPKMVKPTDPILYIIPVNEYKAMWDAAGNPTVSTSISQIYTKTVALPNPPPTSKMPALPPERVTGVNDLAVQIKRVPSDINSASKSGYRFVGRWAQDANPVTNQNLWYTYQGFTNDGVYLVSFFYPVTTSKLPASQSQVSAQDMEQFNKDPQAFIKAQADTLNTLAPSDWQPDLATLDKMVASLAIKGMTQSGLQGITWKWLGSSYQGKDTLVTNPENYQLTYSQNGTLQVKADCNTASGTYTYDGGSVGSVRVTMGPTTLAACGPDSRSQELISSLAAAQDYRVLPGGLEMQLNMPAGGPVLRFANGGPTPNP